MLFAGKLFAMNSLGHIAEMFVVDRGIFLMPSRIGLDVTRGLPIGFISHAHMDHAARHRTTICTRETGELVRHRLGQSNFRTVEFGQSIDVAGHKMKLLPAGHVLGSAMLWTETPQGSLLYTGDYQLGESRTARAAELISADFLIMECTFGHPRYCLPSREEATARLVDGVHKAISRGATPIITAYALGKAQEVTKILTDAGITVLQQRDVFAVSSLYEELGCQLGDFRLLESRPITGTAVVVPPGPNSGFTALGAHHVERFRVTGWAADPEKVRKAPRDHWIPLSDHADFPQLIETVEQVSPKIVFCTHGPKTFVEELRRRGWDARWLA